MNNIIQSLKKTDYPERKGYKLVKKERLYIPYKEIGIESLIRTEAPLNLYFETILKLIEAGFDNILDIIQILGLEYDVLKEVHTDMVEKNYIHSSAGKLALTPKGIEALKLQREITISKYTIHHVYVNLITGEISDDKGKRLLKKIGLEMCLDSSMQITPELLNSKFEDVDVLFGNQQADISAFGRKGITKELYQILSVDYENLLYEETEIFIYLSFSDSEVKYEIKNDFNDIYLNAFFNQIKMMPPCLNHFFEKDRNLIRTVEGVIPLSDETKDNITTSLISCLKAELSDDTKTDELFYSERYLLVNEFYQYFYYIDKKSVSEIIISTSRLNEMLQKEIVSICAAFTTKAKIQIIYQENGYNVPYIIDRLKREAYKKENIYFKKREQISPVTEICFYPNFLIEIEEYVQPAFEGHFSYKIGSISYNEELVQNWYTKNSFAQ